MMWGAICDEGKGIFFHPNIKTGSGKSGSFAREKAQLWREANHPSNLLLR
jgi:hypothetical protein